MAYGDRQGDGPEGKSPSLCGMGRGPLLSSYRHCQRTSSSTEIQGREKGIEKKGMPLTGMRVLLYMLLLERKAIEIETKEPGLEQDGSAVSCDGHTRPPISKEHGCSRRAFCGRGIDGSVKPSSYQGPSVAQGDSEPGRRLTSSAKVRHSSVGIDWQLHLSLGLQQRTF